MTSRVLLFSALVVLPVALRAQNPAPQQRPVKASVRTMIAHRVTSPLNIDGKLDEPAWSAAEPSGDFTQSYPKAGEAPTEKSAVRVLYDDNALYVGIRMFDSRPDSIAAQLARRDASNIYSDWVHLVIDSYHDRRSGFRFSVNPRGVQKDVLHSDDRNEDPNWDAVWEAATVVDSTGWTVEYRIPFSQLRFGNAAKGQERVWGIQVQRDIARKSERDTWSPWKSTDPGYISFAGDLTGIVDIPTPQRLEVMPYASAKLARSPGVLSDPFYRRNDFKPSFGADLKYGLPGGLTLTATANPDFGQVEVDPAVVNLSAFESFFPEKRPFFVEGADIFNLGRLRGGPSYGFQQIFYSRRIGRSPELSADGDFTDSPVATTILGAGKLTGKAGPWTVGVLDAVTAEEKARFADLSGQRGTTPVEPAANYFVSRIRRDFNGGNTDVSGGVTSVFRDLNDPVFKDALRSSANVGAIDFEHQWDNHIWALTGTASISSIAGASTVIANAQQSSARYYQRPDADYLSVDPKLTTLNGNSISLGLNKGGDWNWGATAKEVSPGYEVNDLGFMGRVDYRNFGISTNYNNNTPGKTFRSFNVGGGTNHAWNYGGDRIWTSIFNYGQVTFNNLWYVGGGSEYDPGAFDDRLTRGGPVGRQPTQYGAYAYGGTDSRKRVSYYLNVDRYGDADGGYSKDITPEIDLRPSTSVTLSFIPGLSYYYNTVQYVQSQTDPLATATYGGRYVFANLHQTTLSASTRVAWTMTPALSLELYAQPFAAAGHYDNFKELAKPRSREYTVYGKGAGSTIATTTDASGAKTEYTVDPDGPGPASAFTISNPDFRVHSLRGNAVVRWQYRPGSALFFVWQQERSGFQPYQGDFQTGRDLRDIFGQPSNVFLVKASFWLSR
jgi:hypothetical protein